MCMTGQICLCITLTGNSKTAWLHHVTHMHVSEGTHPTCAGQVCHGNATLSQLDVSRLGVRCAFPFGELAAFGSLNTLYLSVDEPPTSFKVRAASTLPQPGS